MDSRRPDVDIVRFLALASMYVAHVAPSPGPARVLELSEYLTMPLFALLVGVGARLGLRGTGGPRWWRSMLVRAAVLFALGATLDLAGAQIVMVLTHLAVLVVVAGLMSRLPTGGVAAAGATAFLVGQTLVRIVPTGPDPLVDAGIATRLAGFAWVDGPYRILPMVLYAALGILLARCWLEGPRSSSSLLPGVCGVGSLAAAATMLAGEQLGLVDLVPYSGTSQETVLDALLATGVLGTGLATARLLDRVRPMAAVVAVLAAAGSMTLTLYALQVLWLAFDVQVLHPGARDDSWTNLAVLLVGSLAIVLLWRSVVRREPWRRGPVEGVVTSVGG